MRILSWNVQCGKACSGTTDIHQTIQHIRSFGKLDVICVQELARNMKEYCASGQNDQLEIFRSAFIEFSAVWGPGFSWPGRCGNETERREFGNLTLIKRKLLDSQIHPLPRPATPGNRQMQRTAIETVIESRIGDISIINTHLAFHDAGESQLQVERLRALEMEREDRSAAPGEMIPGCYEQNFQPKARILCGDFNFGVESHSYQYQIENCWIDAWKQENGDTPHKPTCGIFDSEQWPEGPHCRDFFWLSQELKENTSSVTVDTDCDLSDHQPVLLEIDI